jgi:hypothetical protein
MTNHKIIQNHIYMISWLPWSWKSFLACFLASNYRIIYSNLEIRDWFWKKVNNTISDFSDIEFIDYNDDKWVLITEEAWVNISSRMSMSETNIEFSKMTKLWRKKNIDLIFISQLRRNVDVDIREMAIYKFDMKSYFVGKNKLMFEITIYDRWDKLLWVKEIDLTEWSEQYWWSYNTLEDSIIIWKDKKQKFQNSIEKIKNKKILF